MSYRQEIVGDTFYWHALYMQIFNFRDGHVTTFRHPSGAYICQMPGHMTLQTSKRHTFRASAFHRYHWLG